MKKIGRYISFFVNIVCCIIMCIIPNSLVNSIQEAGYSDGMFNSIFSVKVLVYSTVLLIIMVSVSKFFKSFEGDTN